MELSLDAVRNWKDSMSTDRFLFLLLGALFLVLWLSLSNVGQADPKLATTIQLFLWASAAAAGGFLFAKTNPQNRFVQYIGLGEEFNTLIFAFIAGGVLAYFTSGAGFSMATFSPSLFDLAALSAFMPILLVKFVSPFAEEFIFAGFLQPTLAMHLGDVPGTLLNAGLFAAGHLLAYGGEPSQLAAAFLFRLIASVGNSYFQSFGFSLGAHFVFNGM